MLAASQLEDIASSAPGRRRVSAPPVARAWRIHVLVIEDDQADASLILSILKRDPRVGMAQATNAPDAILYGLAGGKLRPNLILLDINMPRLNGFKFLDALRQIPIMQDVPVVFLTTSRLASDVERARASSCSLYLVKPDSYDEFRERLGAVVEQAVTGTWSK